MVIHTRNRTLLRKIMEAGNWAFCYRPIDAINLLMNLVRCGKLKTLFNMDMSLYLWDDYEFEEYDVIYDQLVQESILTFKAFDLVLHIFNRIKRDSQYNLGVLYIYEKYIIQLESIIEPYADICEQKGILKAKRTKKWVS